MNQSDPILESASKNLLYVTDRPPIVMERGEGMFLFDTKGKSYLDFIGGWAVNALGHSPVEIEKALCEQGGRLLNASPYFLNPWQVELGERLTRVSGMDRIWFGSTGAEVNEAAIKLARKFGKQNGRGYEILSASGGFHGRTLAMMAATGKKHWPGLFGPPSPGFRHVPHNDLNAMEEAITTETIAIILEPVLGEGGAVPADLEYITGLRKLCDERGLLLILDEVQTGMGRTGSLFAFQDYGVMPDILTLGKGIGGGFPLSAMLTRESLNIFEAGDHGGTYGGQPLGMAVGLAVLERVTSPGFLENVRNTGGYLKERLGKLEGSHGIKNIRGKGLLVACDLPRPMGKELVLECLERGLVLNSPSPGSLRFIPPLIATRDHVDRMMEILVPALEEVMK